jgi:hypothetical protein
MEKREKEIDVCKVQLNEGGGEVWRREVVLRWCYGFRGLRMVF